MTEIRYDICVDARLLNKSGIGRYLREILPLLSNSFDISCLVTIDGIPFMKEHEIPFVIFEAPIYSIREQFLFRKLVPKCKIFWSPHFNVPVFPVNAESRVVTIHDAYHLAHLSQLRAFEKVYAKIFYNLALKLSTKIITVSNFSKAEILKYTSKQYEPKISVIYNGVSKFNTKPQTNSREIKYFLFVGNVKPHKNLKNAILAFREFRDKNPNSKFKFKIVGQIGGFINADVEIDDLLSKEDLDHYGIEFTGYVDDVELAELYQNAFCLIFPSIYEGFGLPPLEAMVTGTPAIVSKRASMPELCGDAVLYFNPDDVRDIALVMKDIVTNQYLYNTLVQKGIDKVKNFEWFIAADNHKNLFSQLILKNNENSISAR